MKTLMEFTGIRTAAPVLKVVRTTEYPIFTIYYVDGVEVDRETYRDILATIQIDLLDTIAEGVS